MRRIALALSLAALPVLAGQPLNYSEGTTKLVGYLARPAATTAKVPGVIVVHQWLGVTDHERKVSDDLAKLGYVALAADIYGEGVKPGSAGEAGKLAGSFKGDRALYRRRVAAAIEALKAQKGVDGSRLAVIGYCFGGMGALEAARAGMPVKGVVSFHGDLSASAEATSSAIGAKVLVCHGADDPYVPAKAVTAFQEEMKKAQADYVFVAYAGAVHAFTQTEAGNDSSKGAAYHAAAHRRSWQHLQDFFQEIF